MAVLSAIAVYVALRFRGPSRIEIEDGRVPPPENIENDPAYEPEGPLKGFKGG